MSKSKPDKIKPDVDINTFPRMVRWFSPSLLATAAFRHIVAGLFGQFADQRNIQSLSDPLPEAFDQGKPISLRHNYATEATAEGKFWVDYAADLGDGFSSTYAVASLMAADALHGGGGDASDGIAGVQNLASGERLEHGRILILGGDQVYPWPTWDAYHDRLELPYQLALPSNPSTASDGLPPLSKRNIYAIPGNHDWYDGLAAFDNLFCCSRSARGGVCGNTIGGWDSDQQRSYYAIKLPHGWWIWAADIQLTSFLDPGQLLYFRMIAEQMQPDDRFILFTAQPTWYEAGPKMEEFARHNLGMLIGSAVARGIKLCGIFAGDWHHYTRYNERESLGNFNLITAGGGGAYLHGTKHLRKKISFRWVDRMLTFHHDRKLKPQLSGEGAQLPALETQREASFPSKKESNRLVWGNLAFPFRNLPFSLGIGVIYWMMAWMLAFVTVSHKMQIPPGLTRRKGLSRVEPGGAEFEGSVQDWTLQAIDNLLAKVSGFNIETLSAIWEHFREGTKLLALAIGSSPFAFTALAALLAVLYVIADAKRAGESRTGLKCLVGGTHFLAHVMMLWLLHSIAVYFLIGRPEGNLETFLNFIDQSLPGADADGSLIFPTSVLARAAVPVVLIPLGMLFGGFIFGLYLILTYRLFGINADWAFSAMRIANYKCFLRFCFESDKLTIYPIGLRQVPQRRAKFSARRSGWYWGKDPQTGRSRLMPRVPLKPELIEGPIVIKKSEVENLPRGVVPPPLIPEPHEKGRML